MDQREATLTRLARRQYGIFTRWQARSAGYSAKAIRLRLEDGRWELIHRNVLAFASTLPTWHAQQLAACFWSKGAASGRAAGFLYELPGCQDPPVEVTTTNRKVMPRCGIVVHLTKWMPAEQVVVVRGIPTTSIERTLLDLSGRLPRRRAAIALDDALRRGLTTMGSLDHCLWLTARRGRDGCGVLRALMKERWDLEMVPNSPLETVILEMLMQSGLPIPALQHEIKAPDGTLVARVDFAYPDRKVIIEGHSKQWHWGAEAESNDLRRHNALVALGWRILYVTWHDVVKRREHTLARVEDLISAPEKSP